MITISLCMIVKNEEKTIGRCLESVKGVFDEIIIVDTGSNDRTKEIVSEYTTKIYDFEWIDDFSAARNFSFSKATMEYIFWLDADDVVLEEDRLKLLELKKKLDTNIDVVIMKYNLGADNNGNTICTFPRERLLKRSKNFVWYDSVHEYLKLTGNIINVDISIKHISTNKKSLRNLNILEKIISDGKPFSNRNLFYYARELFINKRYDDALIYYKKFFETEDGLISNYVDASLDLSYCYKIKGDKKNQLKTLINSFEYDLPKAEICCRIGYYYKENDLYEKAICWFNIATNLKKPEGNTTSIIHDYWGFIPYSEMCYCHSKTNNYKEAFECNKKAGIFKPNDSVYLHNKEFFKNQIGLSE